MEAARSSTFDPPIGRAQRRHAARSEGSLEVGSDIAQGLRGLGELELGVRAKVAGHLLEIIHIISSQVDRPLGRTPGQLAY